MPAEDRLTTRVGLEGVEAFESGLGRMGAAYDKLARTERERYQHMRTMGLATAAAGAALTALGANALRAASQFEGYRATLETVAGSTQRATELYEYAVRTARGTPFTYAGIMEATVALTVMGYRAEDLIPKLMDLTSVYEISKTDIASMTQAWVRFLTGGGTELLRERGLAAHRLAQQFGYVESQVKDSSHTLGVFNRTAESVEGATKRLGNTVAGAMADVEDATTGAAQAMGDDLAPAFRQAAEAAASLLGVYEQLPGPMQKVIAYTVGIGGPLASFGGSAAMVVAQLQLWRLMGIQAAVSTGALTAEAGAAAIKAGLFGAALTRLKSAGVFLLGWPGMILGVAAAFTTVWLTLDNLKRKWEETVSSTITGLANLQGAAAQARLEAVRGQLSDLRKEQAVERTWWQREVDAWRARATYGGLMGTEKAAGLTRRDRERMIKNLQSQMPSLQATAAMPDLTAGGAGTTPPGVTPPTVTPTGEQRNPIQDAIRAAQEITQGWRAYREYIEASGQKQQFMSATQGLISALNAEAETYRWAGDAAGYYAAQTELARLQVKEAADEIAKPLDTWGQLARRIIGGGPEYEKAFSPLSALAATGVLPWGGSKKAVVELVMPPGWAAKIKEDTVGIAVRQITQQVGAM